VSASTAAARARTCAWRSASQQNQGYLPDGTARLSCGGEPIRHFMGTSTFAEYTVMPEIALAKVSPDAPLEHACLFACGLSPGSARRCSPPRSSPARARPRPGRDRHVDRRREHRPALVQRYLDGDIDVAPFVSHRITLDDVNHGFELMHNQDGIRSVIDF
jgi:Zn-dependent alcohol dehydrogenase